MRNKFNSAHLREIDAQESGMFIDKNKVVDYFKVDNNEKVFAK